MKERVFVTGIGCVSPFGRGLDKLINGIRTGDCAISQDPDLYKIIGLRSFVCGSVQEELNIKEIPRRHRRVMPRMAVFACLATIDALQQAGLDQAQFNAARGAICIGSTVGSGSTLEEIFSDYIPERSIVRLKSASFFKTMNHSTAANIATALSLTGRIMSLSSACATSNQNIGLGYELIAANRLDMAIVGGSDELHPLTLGVFDVLNAASVRYNDTPKQACRPFDAERDGVICSEGSGILILESEKSATARKAEIYGEIVGFASKTDVASLAHPNPLSMEMCMRESLADAGLPPEAIGYVNAHATGTPQGDVAESIAIYNIFGDRVPVSSYKGHIGHTMAASGSLETLICLDYKRNKSLIPTLNLTNVDPECAGIQHLRHSNCLDKNYVLKNNFAFGGVNSSLVIRI